MKLAISLATRGRPAQLLDTIKRSVVNWTDPSTRLYVIVDHDDQQTIDAIKNTPIAVPLADQRTEQPLYLVIKDRPDTVAEKWNAVAELCPDADVYLTAADDDPHITPGYDTKVLEAADRLTDGIGVVYGHMANASFTSVMGMTKKFVDKVGYIFPPYFPYWFVDHWIDDVARLIDRISFADVRTDQSKAPPTQEFREPAWWGTWYDAAYMMRRRQAEAIIKGDDFLECPGRKEMLLTHYPLIEHRSRWINNNVRGMGMTHGPAHDERYLRVKKKAIEMVPTILEGMQEFPETDVRGAPPGSPGFLGSWGSQLYAYYLTPPETISSIPKAC